MVDKPTVDLTNCDREPIHIPGSIQSHGCLVACDASAGICLRHSANANAMLGCDTEINGSKLETVVGGKAAHDLRNALATTGSGTRPALLFGVMLPSGQAFDIAIHRYKYTTIIEFERRAAMSNSRSSLPVP